MVWVSHKGAAYRYSSLPRGQCLEGDKFKSDLQAVFEVHALNAERLAPLGSTKANESFNNVVASKAPKSRHYSSSESLDFRIGAAVSQKNLGPGYLMSAYKKKCISPGKALALKAKQLQRKAARRKAQSTTKAFKRRRLHLAESRCKFTEEHEVRGGQTYETNIALSDVQDVTQIPDPEVLPVSKRVDVDDYQLIMFDLETCSTEWDTDICQISAVVDEAHVFNKYILPRKPISHFASKSYTSHCS
ncbi:uncharacterized protein LOC124276171 [Haliotis rubra]|uniref:uncharacterized protein LOC124276171 n=1 Tax=Haliotis rubra TaxID=36100 RepID=UPI001EE58278|nr:uncharacterized protein LOC124276171 [Haliotis rubra]